MPTLARKSKTPLAKLYGAGQDRYLELLEKFPLRPIRTEEELDSATEVIHELIDNETLTKAEEDYLEVLTRIVEKYEQLQHPVDEVSAHEMLAELMVEKELTQSEVAKGAGIAVSTVSELLSGKRKMNLKQVTKLAAFFKVSPAVFLPSADA